jgi:hypothetical protein
MQTKPRLAVPALAIVAGCALLSPASALTGFHPAQTPMEIALDKLLHAADADGNQLANLVHRPGADGRVDYRQMLTPKLIAAITKAERDLVQKDCGGKYKKGELCGLDYSPITCAQDTSPSYLYHSVLEFESKAVIEYAWPNENETAATYTLVKDKSGWKLDGITCAHSKAFN